MNQFGSSFWKEYAAKLQSAEYAERSAIIQEVLLKTGCSKQTVYRQLGKHGFHSGKKTKSTAGTHSFPELSKHLKEIAKLHYIQVAKDQTMIRQPMERTIELYQDSLPTPVPLPSPSYINQLFRREGIGKADMKTPDPHVIMRSREIMETVQIDSSICRFYLDEKGNLLTLGRGENYKNKLFLDDKKKTKIYRWVATDHLSGAFYVHYMRGENVLDIAEFLYIALSRYHTNLPITTEEGEIRASEYPFHGIPRRILTDNGPALRSFQFRQLLSYLSISLPPVKPYKARVKGSVEKNMDIWEVWFESSLILSPPKSIQDLNERAYLYAIHFQNKKKHTRHGMTRFAKWMEIDPTTLQELPDYKTYQSLLHSEPEARSVDGNGKFPYKGQKYTLIGITNTKVDVSIHPHLYKADKSVTVQYPSRELNERNYKTQEFQTLVVKPDVKDEEGYPQNVVFVGEFQPIESTPKQDFKKEILTASAKGQDMGVNPFQNQRKKSKIVSFVPIHGHQITPVTTFTLPEKTYSTIQAKLRVATKLTRMLLPHELCLFTLGNYTEADIQTIIENLTNPGQKQAQGEKNA